MSPQPVAAASVEEIMLRRKASAALSALERSGNLPPQDGPLFATLQLSRATSVPMMKSRPRSRMASPAMAETIAFGRRAPLPPSQSRSSVEYFPLGKPPPAFLAMTHTSLGSTSGLGRPPRTAPSHQMAPPIGRLGAHPSHDAHHHMYQNDLDSAGARRGGGRHTAMESDRHGDRHGAGADAFHGAGSCSPRSGGEIVGLSDEVTELADRLAQVERVTALLTPEFSNDLQQKLQRSFHYIGGYMGEMDSNLLTDQQKREIAAATVLQARVRCFIRHLRYKLAVQSLLSWKARELTDVGAPLVQWLRRREVIEEAIAARHVVWTTKTTTKVLHSWFALAIEGRPARKELESELKARRHCRHALLSQMLWLWRRVAHHAQLCDVRWVQRGNRRVALRKDVAQAMEDHLLAWRQFVYVSGEVRRRFGDISFRGLARTFYAFKEIAHRRRKLRKLTISRWQEVSRGYWQLPFRAWYLFMIDAKLLRRARSMLIGSFSRKVVRRFLQRIVSTWREYVVYGQVEVRSRSQLVSALKSQEELATASEAALDEYSKVLIEAERSLQAEARNQHILARAADTAHTELASLRVRCHSAQQEVLRLRTLVRQYELRYPRAFATHPGVKKAHTLTPSPAGARAAGEEGASSGAAADGHTLPAPPMPPPPLIVDEGMMSRMARLGAASKALLDEERYVPPADGGSMADKEMRRVRQLLAYVLSGQLPDSAPMELRDIHWAAAKEMRSRQLDASARVYSDDNDGVRPIQMALPAAAPPAASQPGGERSALIDGMAITDDGVGVGTMHHRGVPESAAFSIAERVAARRVEIQERVRQVVNLYAPDGAVVESVEEAQDVEKAHADSASQSFAQALVGL